jgi:hypothetical protein
MGNVARSVSRELRCCCDGNLGHTGAPAQFVDILKMNDGANALAFVHQVKCVVDFLERHREGNEFVNLDFIVHVLIHHAGQL